MRRLRKGETMVMTLQDWARLEKLPEKSVTMQRLLRRTEFEDEHPEIYNGPCFCRLCKSYADS